MSGASLYASFDDLRARDPRALALRDADRGLALDRDALARLVDRVAAALGGGREVPLERGARIGLQIPNSPEMVAAVLACWREGWVPALLDRELAPAEVAAIRDRLGLASVRVGADLAERWPRRAGKTSSAGAEPPASRGSPPPGSPSRGSPSRGSPPPGSPSRGSPPPGSPSPGSASADSFGAPVPARSGAAALLKLTSGSTGEPRGVALDADALLAGGTQILTTMGIGSRDRNLVTIPLAHSYGFDNVVLALVLAGTAAVLTADLTPLRLLTVARAHEATVLPSVPFLLDLLSRSSAPGGLPAVRLVVSAGAPLPRETRERFHARFGLRPRTFYGSTECGGISFDREGTADLPEGCVGTALDGVAVELVDGEDATGRLAVRSRSVATGYVPASGLDEQDVLGRGRFLTADVGRLDEKGRLHLLGRALDVINVGGRKVYPAEVERVIRSVPGVRDVVVLGIERTAVAAALRAVVEAEPGVARGDVIAACERNLARYKVPRLVELRSALPRTARGKIDRKKIG